MRNVSVAALTKNLADELGPHGISAVCVHPGLTRTEKTPGVLAAQAKAQGVSEAEIEKRMAARNLARKIITAEEIAYVVAFIASPKAVALNGDVIAAGSGPADDGVGVGSRRLWHLPGCGAGSSGRHGSSGRAAQSSARRPLASPMWASFSCSA